MLVFSVTNSFLISDAKETTFLCNAENCSKPSGILNGIQINVCKTWYHGVCVNLNLRDSEKPEFYKCLKCSNVRLIDHACSNELTLENMMKSSKARFLKRVSNGSRAPVADILTKKLMIYSETRACVKVG